VVLKTRCGMLGLLKRLLSSCVVLLGVAAWAFVDLPDAVSSSLGGRTVVHSFMGFEAGKIASAWRSRKV
jgi:hypothetical protein